MDKFGNFILNRFSIERKLKQKRIPPPRITEKANNLRSKKHLPRNVTKQRAGCKNHSSLIRKRNGIKTEVNNKGKKNVKHFQKINSVHHLNSRNYHKGCENRNMKLCQFSNQIRENKVKSKIMSNKPNDKKLRSPIKVSNKEFRSIKLFNDQFINQRKAPRSQPPSLITIDTDRLRKKVLDFVEAYNKRNSSGEEKVPSLRTRIINCNNSQDKDTTLPGTLSEIGDLTSTMKSGIDPSSGDVPQPYGGSLSAIHGSISYADTSLDTLQYDGDTNDIQETQNKAALQTKKANSKFCDSIQSLDNINKNSKYDEDKKMSKALIPTQTSHEKKSYFNVKPIDQKREIKPLSPIPEQNLGQTRAFCERCQKTYQKHYKNKEKQEAYISKLSRKKPSYIFICPACEKEKPQKSVSPNTKLEYSTSMMKKEGSSDGSHSDPGHLKFYYEGCQKAYQKHYKNKEKQEAYVSKLSRNKPSFALICPACEKSEYSKSENSQSENSRSDFIRPERQHLEYCAKRKTIGKESPPNTLSSISSNQFKSDSKTKTQTSKSSKNKLVNLLNSLIGEKNEKEKVKTPKTDHTHYSRLLNLSEEFSPGNQEDYRDPWIWGTNWPKDDPNEDAALRFAMTKLKWRDMDRQVNDLDRMCNYYGALTGLSHEDMEREFIHIYNMTAASGILQDLDCERKRLLSDWILDDTMTNAIAEQMLNETIPESLY